MRGSRKGSGQVQCITSAPGLRPSRTALNWPRAAWAWLAPPLLVALTRYAMFAVFGLGFGVWFTRRVLFNSSRYTDLVLNDALGKANT